VVIKNLPESGKHCQTAYTVTHAKNQVAQHGSLQVKQDTRHSKSFLTNTLLSYGFLKTVLFQKCILGGFPPFLSSQCYKQLKNYIHAKLGHLWDRKG
jgi:hypothetical protein